MLKLEFLSPTLWKWIELAEHLSGENLSFMPQLQYDCLQMCVPISEQPDGLVKTQKGVGDLALQALF